jgi:RNA polymerase sigma factor (sigma-70 family)
MANGLNQVLDHLKRVLGHDEGGPTDGQLLARFVAERDEAAFAALVRRHGPMVLGVCRRVLRDRHDAEDAFQAAFLLLSCKAASVVRREAVGGWLYRVAYHAALEARARSARRRAREYTLEGLPHPAVAPAEPQDWRPLLDEELNRLPEKYRAAVVLCELEGQPRKAAARQLGLPEGTLSSRLAAAPRRLLARRLARRGLALPAALSAAAAAEVPAALAASAAKAAALVAAGQLATVATPVAALTRGVLKAMLLAKVKVAVVAVVAASALGAGGLAYRAGPAPAAAQAPRPTELDALRKENELLKLNLQVVLEKVRAREAELAARKAQAKQTPSAAARALPEWLEARSKDEKKLAEARKLYDRARQAADAATSSGALFWSGPFPTDPVKEIEAALQALRAARDAEAKRRAADALEAATRRLREQLKPAPGAARP